MKRFLLLTFFICFTALSLPVLAEDSDFWDEPMKIDSEAKNQQKAVTDQEFEKVMKFFEKKKKKKEEKNKPKGTPIGQQLQDNIQPPDENAFKVTYEEYPTVMIPVTLINYDYTEITPGFYRILSVNKDNRYYLNFYQGNSLIAKVPAINTGNDHNQKSLNYAKIIPINNTEMNIIYGDIDCNIEAVLRIKQQ